MVFRTSRRRLFAPTGALAAVALASVLLAACSSSGGNGTTSTTSPPSSSSTSSTAAQSSTSTSAASTSSTVAAMPTCSTGVLQVAETGGSASAGTVHLTFTVTNSGPTTCMLEGYPELAFFGPSGASGAGAGPKLDLTTSETGPPPAAVTLAPKSSADLVLSVANVPVNGVGCQDVASVTVTPPSSTESLSVPASFQACGSSVGVFALSSS